MASPINKISTYGPQAAGKLISKKEGLKEGKEGNSPAPFDAALEAITASVPEKAIHISKHAQKRLTERNIDINPEEYLKLKEAISRLKDKGGKESLVITDAAAYIIDVDNQRVVTAMDKGQLSENVFTNIDSTIFA